MDCWKWGGRGCPVWRVTEGDQRALGLARDHQPGLQFPTNPDPCSPASRARGGSTKRRTQFLRCSTAHPLSELGCMLFDFSPLTARRTRCHRWKCDAYSICILWGWPQEYSYLHFSRWKYYSTLEWMLRSHNVRHPSFRPGEEGAGS